MSIFIIFSPGYFTFSYIAKHRNWQGGVKGAAVVLTCNYNSFYDIVCCGGECISDDLTWPNARCAANIAANAPRIRMKFIACCHQ